MRVNEKKTFFLFNEKIQIMRQYKFSEMSIWWKIEILDEITAVKRILGRCLRYEVISINKHNFEPKKYLGLKLIFKKEEMVFRWPWKKALMRNLKFLWVAKIQIFKVENWFLKFNSKKIEKTFSDSKID